jgi:hypothetical protein
MRFIPQCYYHSSILDFIKDKIDYSGIKSFDYLDDIDQEKLTTLCMDTLGHDAYQVLIEGDNTDNTITHLKKYMLTADMDEAYELLSSIKKNAVQSIKNHMNDLFEDILSERKAS